MLFQTKRYKLLLERVDTAERRMADLAEQQHQLHEALTQQQAQSEREIAGLRETVAGQSEEIREAVQMQRSQHESVVALVKESHHQFDRLRDDITASLVHQGEQAHQRLQELDTALGEQRQVIEQVAHLLAMHTEQQADTRGVQQREIEALLERQAHDVEAALQRVRQGVTADHTAFTQRFEQIEAALEQLASHTETLEGLLLGWQQRVSTQEQQIAALHAHLQEEVQAREKLAQQVASGAAQRTRQPRRKPQA